MSELGKAVRSAGRVYFTGGVSAVLLGWREMLMDLFSEVELQLIRYPAIDPQTLRQRMLDVCAETS